MPQKTFKMVEIVGVSDESIQQAVRNALRKARQTLRHIDWFEVTGIRGYVRPDGEPEFQVQIKLGFRLLDAPVTGEGPAPTRRGSGTAPSRTTASARKVRGAPPRGRKSRARTGAATGPRAGATRARTTRKPQRG